MTSRFRATVAVVGLVLMTFSVGGAQERVNLTTPETKPNNTQYTVDWFRIVRDRPGTAGIDEGRIELMFIGENGEFDSCAYSSRTSPTGTFLINGLNKADLSSIYNNNATTGSLFQRINHRLVVMGESAQVCDRPLVGTLAGTVP